MEIASSSTFASSGLFSSALWNRALESYGNAAHLTVELYDADARAVLGPMPPTPLFQLFKQTTAYDPGIFAECARRCLRQTNSRPAVMVSEFCGLSVIGTSLVLDTKVVGAAVGGYAFTDFSQISEVQRLARDSGITFEQLWEVARQQKPVPTQRLQINGELLQVLGDALLRENYRTRQYEHTVQKLEETARAKDLAHQELQQTASKLVTSQRESRYMAERLLSIRETESQSLARDLHDDLSQKLAAVGMEISMLAKPGAGSVESLQRHIRKLGRKISAMADNVHAVSRRLHPAILDDLGLEAAIREEITSFSERSGISVHFRSQQVPRSIPAAIALCLFRVAQEGLRNVEKYARVEDVRMVLTHHDSNLALTIEDLGEGFDVEAVRRKGGLGLISMEERARQANGEFSIRSQPGRGTEIEVLIPFDSNCSLNS